MKCADPILCYTNDNGNRIFRHFSLADQFVKTHHQKVFPCGKCLQCRKQKSRILAQRCVLHASMYEQNCFLTLTYDEKKEGYHNEFQYEDIQKFKKNLQRQCWYHNKKRIQIFNVHEYGKNGKKHWHLVVFNHDFPDKTIYTKKNGIPIYTSKKLKLLWPHGFNTIGDVTEASAMYQSQYMEKDFKNNNVTSKKKSHSKHSGIGKPYFQKHYKQLLQLGYITISGNKMPLPRYFEKLADKHYRHFHYPAAFRDTHQRKKLYRPFKHGEANEEISNLYIDYLARKETIIKELEKEWDQVISQHLQTDQEPDFVKAGRNALYDLTNKKSNDQL